VEGCNASDHPVQIKNGIAPWEFDQMGTAFYVSSFGKSLARKSVFTPVGRTGPINLAPKEHQSGTLPIGSLYPEMKGLLEKQPVAVNWEYWTSHQATSDRIYITGTVQIDKSPCQ
jgi:hypothetical protein